MAEADEVTIMGLFPVKAIVPCHHCSATRRIISGSGEYKSLHPQIIFDLLANGGDGTRDGHKGSIL